MTDLVSICGPTEKRCRHVKLLSPSTSRKRPDRRVQGRRAMAELASIRRAFQHDLAEMLVRFHVGEGVRHLRERIDAVDGDAQLARRYRFAQIGLHQAADLADFGDGAGAEGHADIVDAAGGVQVEVELARKAAEPADIDDAAQHFGAPQRVVHCVA